MVLIFTPGCPPDTKWAQYKDVMYNWYIEQDKTLKQVQDSMKTDYDFHGKKSDFERYFREWGFKKNLKQDEWQAVGRMVQKRKREGKSSDVYLNGHYLPAKKVRKELLRNCRHALVEKVLQEYSPSPPLEVQVLTPPSTDVHNIEIVTRDLPYFQFGKMLDNMWLQLSGPQQHNTSGFETFTRRAVAAASELQDLSTFQRRLETDMEIFPSMLYSENWALVSLQQICYLLSNNLDYERSDEAIERFLESLDNKENLSILQMVLQLPGWSTQSLSEALFYHAIRCANFRVFKLLLDLGFDANRPLRHHLQRDRSLVPLACAVSECAHAMIKWSLPQLRVSQLQETYLKMMRELIVAGTDVNGRSAYISSWGEPLKLALNYGNASLVTFLLNHGAKCDEDFTSACGESALRMAFLVNNSRQTIAQLLGRGAVCALRYEYERLICLKNALIWHGEMCNGSDDTMHSEMIHIVEKILDSGADLNFSHGQPRDFIEAETPLEVACETGCLIMTRNLCERGAKLSDLAVVLAAGVDGKDSVLTYLLQCRGANPSAVAEGVSALTSAIVSGHPERVQFLLDSGANVNVPVDNKYGDRLPTPLQSACRRGYLDVVSALLKAGADVNASPSSYDIDERFDGAGAGYTALTAAVTCGSLDILNLLLNAGVKVNEPCEQLCQTPLAIALAHGKVDMVQRLTTVGSTETQALALHTAIMLGKTDMLIGILEGGADINALVHTSQGKKWPVPPLAAAIDRNDSNAVLLLLEAGAETNGPGVAQAMFDSVYDERIVKAVIDTHLATYGTIRQPFGAAVLSKAIVNNDVETFQLLLCHGADTDCFDPHFSLCEQRLETSMLIFSMTYSANPAYFVSELLRWGADPDLTVQKSSWESETALTSALNRGHEELIPTLIKAGADVNILPSQTTRSRTALQKACEKGNMHVVEQLLAAGADVNQSAGPVDGITALQAAAIKGHIEIVRLLIARGADVNAPGAPHSGRTALEGAAEHGRLDVTQMLLNYGAQTHDHEQFERALRFATENGHFALSRLLWEHHGLTAPASREGPRISNSQYREQTDDQMSTVSRTFLSGEESESLLSTPHFVAIDNPDETGPLELLWSELEIS